MTFRCDGLSVIPTSDGRDGDLRSNMETHCSDKLWVWWREHALMISKVRGRSIEADSQHKHRASASTCMYILVQTRYMHPHNANMYVYPCATPYVWPHMQTWAYIYIQPPYVHPHNPNMHVYPCATLVYVCLYTCKQTCISMCNPCRCAHTQAHTNEKRKVAYFCIYLSLLGNRKELINKNLCIIWVHDYTSRWVKSDSEYELNK